MSLNNPLALRPRLFLLTTVIAVLFCAQTTMGQTLVDVDFNNRGASTYTEEQVEDDFGEIRFSNGVDEGWVRVVTGREAFGGTGSAIRVRYPEGGEGPGEGGAQWIVEFDEGYEEAYLSYRVKFAEGFDFVRGGKLPGLAGGSAPSGSAPADGVRGWSGRLMWRTAFRGTSGQPEQNTSGLISYAKHVHSGFAMDGRQEDEVFVVEPSTGQQSVIVPDQWYTIRQRVVMNTPGQRDGILQIWLDGRLVHNQNNLQYRNTANLQIDRFFFSTFFGGGEVWRSSKEEFAFFDDIKLTIPQERRVPEQYSSPNAAVAAAGPGDTILLGSADWFGNLTINDPMTIRGRQNARLMAARGDAPIIQVNSDNVNIESLEFTRGLVGVEGLSLASRLSIVDCEFREIFGDAIRCTDSRGVTIINATVDNNEGRGVFLNRVNDFSITNSSATRNGGAGFEIFSDNGFIADCEANNNRAGAGFFLIGSDCGLVNNVSENNNGMGFLLIDTRNIGFTNNTAASNSNFGVLGFSATNCFFGNNRITDNDSIGLILDNSRGILVEANVINNNTGIGAYFSPSTRDNAAIGNSYRGNAFELGLIDDGNNFSDE